VRKTWIPACAGMTARAAGMTVAMIVATPALAEWVKVGRSDAAVHYVDPATVHRDGNLRRVWAMQDMVETSVGGVRSIRALQEYDCAETRFRFISIATHSGPMAGGAILARHELRDEWSARKGGTNASVIEKIVCER
jgi:hypothetical protein